MHLYKNNIGMWYLCVANMACRKHILHTCSVPLQVVSFGKKKFVLNSLESFKKKNISRFMSHSTLRLNLLPNWALISQHTVFINTAYFCIIFKENWLLEHFFLKETESCASNDWDEKRKKIYLWLLSLVLLFFQCSRSLSLLLQWITSSWPASVPWPACVMFCGQPTSWTDRIPFRTLDIWRAFLWNGCICGPWGGPVFWRPCGRCRRCTASRLCASFRGSKGCMTS